MRSRRDVILTSAIVSLVIIGLPDGDASGRHLSRPRVSTRQSTLLFSAPLTTSVIDLKTGSGAFSRGTVSTCQTTAAGATVTDLSGGTACQSASLGTRLAAAATNKGPNSEAVNSWVATSTTVTADAATAPDGSATAERVQMDAVADRVIDATVNACTAGVGLTYSIWLRNRNAGTCIVWIGNANTVDGLNRGGYVTISGTWGRYAVTSQASLSGDCDIYLGWLSATATCTDYDVWGEQVEESVIAPGQYCPTAGVAATCAGETLEYAETTKLGRAVSTRYTVSLDATWGTRASYHQSDGTLLLLEASTTWRLTYDDTSDMLTHEAGGQTVAIPAPGNRYTSHTVGVAGGVGQPICIWYDALTPVCSTGTYTPPTITGSLWLGSTAAGAGQTGIFMRDVKIRKRYSVPQYSNKHYATLLSGLTPTIGAAAYTFARSTAWTCPASGGSSLGSVAVNTPCYRSAGGDAIGVRVHESRTNRVRDLAGVVGNTPTGWTSAGAGSPVIIADPYYGTVAITYTEAATASQFVYVASGQPAGTILESYYLKQDAATTSGNLFLWNTLQRLTIPGGAVAWRRLGATRTVTAPTNYFLGSFNSGACVAPTAGTLTIDAPMVEINVVSYGPYCDGAVPPTTCGAEALTQAFSATELPSASGTLYLLVHTLFDSASIGIDRTLFFANADFKVQLMSTGEWRYSAGGQTVQTSAQVFPAGATHLVIITWADGAPLTIAANGEAAVSSAGNKNPQALDATKYLGSSATGGDEINGHIGYVTVR